MKIALDTMIFIYLFENDRRYLPQVDQIFKRIAAGEDEAVVSAITVAELLSAPKLKSPAVAEINRFFRDTGAIKVAPCDTEVAALAGKLRRTHRGLRTPDALVAATALSERAEILVTNDINLGKLKLPGLMIRMLKEM